jgi:two-component system, response regulator PdtaR
MTTKHQEIAETAEPVPAALPKTVLIAEDEHLVARSLEADLTDLGVRVVGLARNGQEAIEMARLHKPQMALLDIRMPVMDGIQAGRVLFEELKLPVMMISAYSDPMYVKAGVEMGVYGYLLKPVTPEELRVGLTIAWAQYEGKTNLTSQIDQLNAKIEDRKIIERAKGVLMKSLKLDEEEAWKLLQRRARDNRKPMVELAKAIIDAGPLIEDVLKAKKPG